MRFSFAICIVISSAWCFPARTFAAPGDLLFQLNAPDGLGTDFGRVVAIADHDLLIAEPGRLDQSTGEIGRAYLFDGASGAHKLTFRNPEPMRLDSFADAIAGGNGRVFITAEGLKNRVYAFDATTGDMLGRIDNPETRSNGFGSGMAYNDGGLLISAPSFGMPGLNAVGRSYLFDSLSGTLHHAIPNPEPGINELFGFKLGLAISEDKIAVGTIADNSFAGRVWVFDRDTNAILFTLENPNPDATYYDAFGWSVAANEKIIAVGANEDETDGIDGSGTVYVFDADTGALRHTLFSPHHEENTEFGRSIAVTSNGDILVGAWNTSVGSFDTAGHVYLFDGDTGRLLLDIPNPEPGVTGVFGWSVAAIDNRIVVGAPAYSLSAPSLGGTVYVFTGVPEPNGICSVIILGFITTAWRMNKVFQRQL